MTELDSIDQYKSFIDLMSPGFAYLEVIFNNDGIPADCRYKLVNRKFEAITGLPAGQVLEKSIRELEQEAKVEWIGFLGQVAMSGKSSSMEWVSDRDKHRYVVHAFSDRQGFCGVTFEDITERAQAEEKLRVAYSRLSSIAEFSADMIFRVDNNGIVQSSSPAVEAILGYSQEEVRGRKVQEFIVPDDWVVLRESQEDVRAGESFQARQFRAIRKDGHIVYIEVSSMPVMEQGRVVGEQGTVRDITARKMAEEELQRKTNELEIERQNLQTIFHYTQIGMLLVDGKGLIQRVNEAATRLVNKHPHEFIGRSPGEAYCCVEVAAEGKSCGHLPGCISCPLWNIYKTALETGNAVSPQEVEREFVINGVKTIVWIEISAARVSISGDSDVILSVADITQRKRMEESLTHSEKRLADVINAFPLPFYFQDIDGRYQIFNQELVGFIGLPADKLRNATIYDIAPQQLAGLCVEKDKDLLIHPGSQVFEAPFLLLDGRLRDVVFFKRTLHDGSGRLQGIVGTLLDITERKKAEARVKESERRLQEFLNATPVPMCLKNPDGMYLFCNQAFAAYHGLAIKDVLGKTAHSIVQRSFAEQLELQDKKLLADGKTVVAELEAIRLGGETRDIIIYKNLHHNTKGKVVGIIATFIDITERKKAEQEIIKRGEEVQEALGKLQLAHDQLQKAQDRVIQAEKLAAIGLLAAGVAHEVNNPLGFIGSNLNILEGYVHTLHSFLAVGQNIHTALIEGDLELLKRRCREMDDQRKAIDIEDLLQDIPLLIKETREGFERIRKIVFELRSCSRTEQVLPQPVDINVVIDGVLRMLESEIKCKANVHKDFGVVPLIYGNPQQLGQVFMNILVNAHQAILERGNIYIKTKRNGHEVVVEIEDDGPGIPVEIMGKIFDPFFTTKAPGEGTGLGLSISYDIVKRHGGSIGAESEVGKGARFMISFPVVDPYKTGI